MIALDKIKIRKNKIQARLDLSDKEYQDKSNLIINKLKKEVVFQKAKTIGIYVSMNNEVDTIKLINELLSTKTICVPKTINKTMEFHKIDSFNELSKGNYGILEPIGNNLISKKDIDVLIVPLVAYDEDNHRIGYGGGYYDRYLQGYAGYAIGLAFSLQYTNKIDTETTDIPLKQIINEL